MTTTMGEGQRAQDRVPNDQTLGDERERARLTRLGNRGGRKAGEAPKIWQAIRQQCLRCCGGSANEVRLCVSFSCHLWPYRFGISPRRAKTPGRLVDPEEAAEIAQTRHPSKGQAKLRKELYRPDGSFVSPLKAIRLHCLECAPADENRDYSPKEVAECSEEILNDPLSPVRCPLRPYRFGVKPGTAEQRGKAV